MVLHGPAAESGKVISEMSLEVAEGQSATLAAIRDALLPAALRILDAKRIIRRCA
jgi:hypothetical protein